MAAVQFPDMRSTPCLTTDSPIKHMVGTTVRGVIYFNNFPMKPVNRNTILTHMQVVYTDHHHSQYLI